MMILVAVTLLVRDIKGSASRPLMVGRSGKNNRYAILDTHPIETDEHEEQSPRLVTLLIPVTVSPPSDIVKYAMDVAYGIMQELGYQVLLVISALQLGKNAATRTSQDMDKVSEEKENKEKRRKKQKKQYMEW